MCTYNAISSQTDHNEIQKRDSEESLLTFVNLFPIYNLVIMKATDGLSSETIVRLFYMHNTIDYGILWDNTQSD